MSTIVPSDVASTLGHTPREVEARIASIRELLPTHLASATEKAERREFLSDSLRDAGLADVTLERVLLGNELQPVAYLERGYTASRAVARIQIGTAQRRVEGWGTGFLICPGVLITNNHVFPSASHAEHSAAQFNFELDIDDTETTLVSYALEPGKLFYTSKVLDFTVVAVHERSSDSQVPLSAFGYLPLLATPGKAFEGEWLTIIQHPNGERKQLCVRENRLLKREENVLWYSTDTMPGSSGSPVFNNDWFVVALHHSGIPEMRNGRQQTVDGRDYDPRTMDETQIKWIANEGIRASRIAETLRAALPAHPLLQPLFSATPSSARITTRAQPTVIRTPLTSEGNPMSQLQTITIPIELKLQIQGDGSLAVSGCPSAASEAAREPASSSVASRREARFDAPFDDDYTTRSGYDPEFLGNGDNRVALPMLSPSLETNAAPLIHADGANRNVLHYHNFSIVMHAERRFAIYSAANVRFDQRFDMSRPRDVWRRDPRILDKYQIQNFYYAGNKFDRGHLTRREDLEFGPSANAALASAADTCHWTNCTPQHERFNQNREIWQGIERHILEKTILTEKLSVQVITGPVFDEGDPEYKDIQYPLQYWKVVAAIDENDHLFATAYIASQEEVIAQYGIEAVELFGPYKTYQVTIAEIERLTGLTFPCGAEDGGSLSAFDPLETRRSRRRPGRSGPSEAAMIRTSSPYFELTELDDIQL